MGDKLGINWILAPILLTLFLERGHYLTLSYSILLSNLHHRREKKVSNKSSVSYPIYCSVRKY